MCLKASDGVDAGGLLTTAAGWCRRAAAYVAGFGLIAVVLDRGMAVGVVYGIWVACGVALTAILGRVIFRDPLTPRMGRASRSSSPACS